MVTAYINIADSVFPSGEIRGQLFATPEPSSIVLAGMAALGLLALPGAVTQPDVFRRRVALTGWAQEHCRER